jgi:hypothetical protein
MRSHIPPVAKPLKRDDRDREKCKYSVVHLLRSFYRGELCRVVTERRSGFGNHEPIRHAF